MRAPHRFRYDTPLHDLERDDWSDEIRFDTRRRPAGPIGHRRRKRPRWLAPRAAWARPWLNPWGPLPVVPFRPELDVGCGCRTRGAEPFGFESAGSGTAQGAPLEEEWFEITRNVTLTVKWTGPVRLPTNQRSMAQPSELRGGGGNAGWVYVMMDPRVPGRPWYVGETASALGPYLSSERWAPARRLGALRCCTAPHLIVYGGKVSVSDPNPISPRGTRGARGYRSPADVGRELVEDVLTKLFVGTRNDQTRLPGNIDDRGERSRHFVTHPPAPGARQTATLRLNLPRELRDAIDDTWIRAPQRRAVRWEQQTSTFTINTAGLTLRDAAQRAAIQGQNPTLGFEVAPFSFP